MRRKTKDPIEKVPPEDLAKAMRLWVRYMARELVRQERERKRATNERSEV